MTKHDDDDLRGGVIRVPRSRGALSGFILLALGIWGALIAFIGPSFDFAYTPDTAWKWTAARGWLEVLPGVVAFVGGLILIVSTNRVLAGFGAWLGILAGAWFLIGRDVAPWFGLGSIGTPAGSSATLRAVESLAFFSALGALILFFATVALGRLSVRSVRDVKVAQKHETRAERERAALREEAYAQGRRDEASAREQDVARDQDLGRDEHAAGTEQLGRDEHTVAPAQTGHAVEPTQAGEPTRAAAPVQTGEPTQAATPAQGGEPVRAGEPTLSSPYVQNSPQGTASPQYSSSSPYGAPQRSATATEEPAPPYTR